MPRRVDRDDALDAEIPAQVGLDEWSDEAARRSIDVERNVGAAAVLQCLQRIGDRGDRLVAPILGGAEDRDNPIVFSSQSGTAVSAVR